MLNGSSICFIFRGFLFGHAQSTQLEMRSHVNYSFLMLLLRSQWPVQISVAFKHIWNSFLLQSFLKIIFCVCLGAIQIPEQSLLGVLFIQTLLSSTSCARGNLCVGWVEWGTASLLSGSVLAMFETTVNDMHHCKLSVTVLHSSTV